MRSSAPRTVKPLKAVATTRCCCFSTTPELAPQEAAQLLIGELDVVGCSVKIRGKGGKQRQCPLWPSTIEELKALIANRSTTARVFLNRCGHPITRFGIHALVERSADKVQVQMPSLAAKRISPHTIRHYAGCRTIPGTVRREERKARRR